MNKQSSHHGPLAASRLEADEAHDQVLRDLATVIPQGGSAGWPAVTTTALLAAVVVMLIACVTVYGGSLP